MAGLASTSDTDDEYRSAGSSEDMKRGGVFSKYGFRETGEPYKDSVLLFYDEDDGSGVANSGVLYWSPASEPPQRNPENSLPLNLLTDVYLEKLTPIFRSDFAADADKERCLSLVSAAGIWNLEAQSSDQITAWLFGINRILTTRGGKEVVVEDETEDTTDGSSTTVDTDDTTAALSFVSLMEEGEEFFVFEMVDGVATKSRQFLWYCQDENLGKFYWRDPATRPMAALPSQSVALCELTDVYLGKQEDVFHSDVAANAPEDRCFSMIGQRRTLNLETLSTEQLTTWLHGINFILTKTGQIVVVDDEEGGSTTEGTTTGYDTNTATETEDDMRSPRRFSIVDESEGGQGISPPLAATMQMMSNGRVFVQYVQEGDVVVGQDILLFYQEQQNGCGALYWCAPGVREVVEERCFPLADITDVYLGKQRAVFQSPAAANSEEGHCFSILGQNGKALDVEVQSMEQLTAWLNAINTILEAQGNRIVLDDEDASTDNDYTTTTDTGRTSMSTSGRRYSVTPSGEATDGTPSQLEPAYGDIVGMMTKGREFIHFVKEGSDYKQEAIFVWFDEESFCWGPLGLQTPAADRQLRLDAISDVYMGKQGDLLEAPGLADVPPERCLSLISPDLTLDLGCESEELWRAWLHGINALLKMSGKRVMLEDQNENENSLQEPSDLRRYSVHSNGVPAGTEATLSLSLAEMVRMLKRGRTFVRYCVQEGYNNDTDAVVREDVFLFFKQESEDDQGALLWCSPASREESPTRRVDLSEITDVYMGKQTPILQAEIAQYAAEERCFSIITPTLQLDIEAESAELLTAWLKAINLVLAQHGRHIVFDGSSSPSPNHPRYSVKSTQDDLGVDSDQIPMLTQGCYLTSYSFDEAGGAHKRKLYIVYRQDDTPSGSLYCCSSAENRDDSERFPLHTLTDIYQGKDSAVFQAPIALYAEEERCLCLVGHEFSLNLEAETSETVPQWIAELNVILQAAGKKVMLEESVSSLEHSGFRRRLSVTPDPYSATRTPPSINMHSPAVNVDAGIMRMMDVGQLFWSYSIDNTGVGVRDEVTLFLYLSQLYWCAPGTREKRPDRCLHIAQLSAVYLGRQTAAFRTPEGSQAMTDNCFSIIGGAKDDQKELNLEAESAEALSAWLHGINLELSKLGRRVLLETVVGEATRSRWNVTGSSATSPVQTPIPEPSNHDFICQGENVTLYTNPGNPMRSEVFMWLATSPYEKLGRLCWADRDDREVSKSQDSNPRDTIQHALSLEKITDLYVGKQTSLLQEELANDADEASCFAVLLGSPTDLGSEFGIETLSATSLQKWVLGISAVLDRHGKRVVEDTAGGGIDSEGEAPNARHFRTPSRRKFSVLASHHERENPFHLPEGVFPTRPQDTMEQLVVRRPTIYSLPNQPVVRMMETGSIFTGYAENRKGKFVKKHLLVFYNAKHGECGTLYWCPPTGPRLQSRNCCLPLRQITDIFLGKHTDVFESVGARDAIASNCFSVMSKSKAIDLEASNPEQLNAWLFGVNSILTESGKKLLQGDEEYDRQLDVGSGHKAQELHRRRWSLLAKRHALQGGSIDMLGAAGVPSLLSPMTPSMLCPHRADTVHMLTKGRIFTKYTTERNECCLLFYAPPSKLAGPLGALYWCSPEAPRKDPRACIHVDQLTTVLVGRQADVFALPHALVAVSECCMSLFAQGQREVHLEAKSTEQLCAWLFGINMLLSGLHVEQETRAADDDDTKRTFRIRPLTRSELQRAGSPLKRTNDDEESAPAVLSPSFHETLRMLTAGRDFTSYTWAGAPHEGEKKDIFLFYAPKEGKAGTLYWCEPGQRVASPHARLALHHVQEVFLGKQTPELQHAVAEGADQDRCLSLLSRDFGLHLEAGSSEQVIAWLFALNSVLTAAGSKCVLDTDAQPAQTYNAASSDSSQPHQAAPRRFSVLAQSSAVKPRAQVPYEQQASRAVQAMSQGRIFTSYEKALHPIRRQLFVFYQAKHGRYGSIYWCEPGERVESSSNRIPLESITNVLVGKHTKVFESDVAKHALEARCISLIGYDDMLNLEAESGAVLNTWLSGIKHILEASGHALVLQEERAMPGFSRRRFSVLTGQRPMSKEPAAHTVAMMERGCDVVVYEAAQAVEEADTKNVEANRRELFLFYEATGGKYGCLYWCERGRRDQTKERCLPLHRISDIFVGKQTTALATADDVADDVCVSLVSKRQALHLELPSADLLKDWLAGVNHVLCTSGRKIVLDEEEPSGQANGFSRQRYSVNQREAAGVNALREPAHALLQMMTDGRTLRMLERSASTGMVQQRMVSVWLQPAGSLAGLRHGASATNVSTGGTGGIDAKFGSLCWCAAQRRDWEEGCQLPLHLITHIYCGSRDPVFQSVPHVTDAHCLSVVAVPQPGGGRGRSIHLQTESIQQRSAWEEGLRYVLACAGRTIELMEDDPAVVEAQSKAGDGWSSLTSRKNYAVTFPARHNPVVAELMGGVSLMRYEDPHGACRRSRVTVFYSSEEGQAGALFWNEEGELQRGDQCLLLEDLMDIYIGKQRTVFQLPMASEAKEDACFSLIGRHTVLDLEADSREHVVRFLAAVNHVLTTTGREVVLEEDFPTEEEGAHFSRRRFSIQSGSGPSSATLADLDLGHLGRFSQHHNLLPTLASLENRETLVVMAQGRPFTYVCMDAEAKGIVTRPCTLWYKPSCVSMFFCPPNEHTEQHGPLPLSELRELFLGNCSETLMHPSAATLDGELLFTLKTPTLEWDFMAPSVEQLRTWLFGIHSILESEDKKAVLEEAGSETDGTPAKRFSVVSEIGSGLFSDGGQHPGVKRMMAGASFDQLVGEHEHAMLVPTFVFWSQTGRGGALFWCPEGSPRVQSPDRCLPLDSLTDIYIGNKHAPFLSCPAARHVSQEACMSLLGTASTLHLVASDALQLNAWLEALQYILENMNKAVQLESDNEEDADKDCSLGNRRYSISASRGSVSEVDPATAQGPNLLQLSNQETVTMMKQGREFTAVVRKIAGTSAVDGGDGGDGGADGADDGAGASEEDSYLLRSVLLRFVEAGGGSGQLEWSVTDQANEAGAGELPLDELDEIFLGKQTPAFRTAAAAEAEEQCCFSLLGARVTIDLIAPSKEVVSAWLFGLDSLLTHDGQRVVLDDHDPAVEDGNRSTDVSISVHPQRRYSVQRDDEVASVRLANRTSHTRPSTQEQQADGTPALREMSKEEAELLLMEGAVFTLHTMSAQDLHAQQVFVFLVQQPNSKGSIGWCAPDRRAFSTASSICLDELTDIFLGKEESPILQKLPHLLPELCFSFVSSTPMWVDLEADSQERINDWISALNQLLTAPL